MANDFTIDNQNDIHIIGTVELSGKKEATIFSYDPSGILVEDSIYQDNSASRGYFIKNDKSNNQILLLSIGSGFYLIKKSSNGDLLWKKEINIEAPKDMLLDSLSSVYILSSDKVTKLNENGEIEWEKYGSFLKMKINKEKKIILITDSHLIKYSSDGELEINKEIQYLNETSIFNFSIDDNIFILGSGTSAESIILPMLCIYDNQGNLINDFSEIVEQFVSVDSGSVVLNTIMTDNKENIVLGGYFEYDIISNASSKATDFFLVKLKANGIPLWKTSFRVESDQSYARSGKVQIIFINENGSILIGGKLYNDYEGNWEGNSDQIYLFKIDENISDVKNTDYDAIDSYSLFQNYPNPFNPTTVINYTIPSDVKSEMANSSPASGVVKLIIHDILGKEVATLVNKEQTAGSYEIEFNASGLSSGVYFYKLQTGNIVETKKMLLLR